MRRFDRQGDLFYDQISALHKAVRGSDPDAWQTYERLGSPEGELALAQAVVFLACAAKSNATYRAYNDAAADARRFGTQEVPMRLRNAPTRLSKELGHGDGYRYAHDESDGFAAGERVYYEPVERGLESQIAAKLRDLRARNKANCDD